MKANAVLLFLLAGAWWSCAGPSAYERQQARCVELARTRAEADACRCSVRADFDRPCDAGGSP